MVSDAINALYDIKIAAFKNAAPLPRKEETQAQWQGLGFLVGGTRLVSKIGDVVELLEVPKLTPLPVVKSWIRGIANIRGRLVPIIDLHEFWETPTTMPVSQWRLLIVEDEDVVAGFLVEQSLGIQHFSEESFEAHDGEGLAALQPFIEGAFRHSGRLFHEVHLKELLRDERFYDVALDKSK